MCWKGKVTGVVNECSWHCALAMSFEPHLDQSHAGSSLLEELDKLAPIKSFDAFPKVQPTYTSQSKRGGVLTSVVAGIIFLLVLVSLLLFRQVLTCRTT